MVQSQYSLERYLAVRRSDYNAAAFSTPPLPGTQPTIDGSMLPNPFPVLTSVSYEESVRGQACARCDGPLGMAGTVRPVPCDVCHEIWHLDCGGLAMPPRYGSWLCPRCDGSRPMPPAPGRLGKKRRS